MAPRKSLKLPFFYKWAHEAAFESVFVYHREPADRDPEVFAYARKLHEGGLVFLFDRRMDNGKFEKCARRTPVAAHLALDKVSASIRVEPSTAYLDEKVDAA